MKILFFDCWLKGVNNFIRLIPEIKKQLPEAEIKMLHTGSWKEKEVPLKKRFEGFTAYDVSFFKTNSLNKILKKEHPDLVVTLNNYFLTDKSVNVFCKRMGIPVVYLSHGRLGSKALASSLHSDTRSIKKNPPKINRENLMMLYNYLQSTIVDRKPARFVKSFYYLLRKPAMVMSHSPYNEELKVARNLVYYNSCKDIMVKERGFPEDSVEVTGNPEFDAFINQEIQPLSSLIKSDPSPAPYFLYLEDGTLQSGILTEEEWKLHFKEVNRILKEKGKNLIVKMHPRTDTTTLESFLKEEGITAIGNGSDLKSFIHHSEAVVSLFSTTITFALYMGKKVFSPRWGVTASISKNFPESVVTYPSHPSEMIKEIEELSPSPALKDYIYTEMGNPDGKAIVKIVSHIRNLIN